MMARYFTFSNDFLMIRRNFSNEFCPNLRIFLSESFAQRYGAALRARSNRLSDASCAY